MATKKAARTYFYGTGRRKKAVACVRVYPGKGQITINDKEMNEYFKMETLKLIVRQPLIATGTEGRFDIICKVVGGGLTGQAGAVRHGLSVLWSRPTRRPLRPRSGRLLTVTHDEGT